MIKIKKIFFGSIYNLSLFLILIIGIQNSSRKAVINLMFTDTINLPISFIIGTSFISGSLIGFALPLMNALKEEK
tara:strand:- start:456 stop:680 length:225 start_codon:yes stop_codon:yes gene_type:complete